MGTEKRSQMSSEAVIKLYQLQVQHKKDVQRFEQNIKQLKRYILETIKEAKAQNKEQLDKILKKIQVIQDQIPQCKNRPQIQVLEKTLQQKIKSNSDTMSIDISGIKKNVGKINQKYQDQDSDISQCKGRINQIQLNLNNIQQSIDSMLQKQQKKSQRVWYVILQLIIFIIISVLTYFVGNVMFGSGKSGDSEKQYTHIQQSGVQKK